jgi:hypothetical protein
MRKLFYILIGLCAAIVLLFVVGRYYGWREKQEWKPFITYTRQMGVASDCDKYKRQYGVWPQSLDQLISFKPELVDWAKDGWGKSDAWGGYVVLVPYDEKLGYGKVISYGRDGKPGGTGLDSDTQVRYPVPSNYAWNKNYALSIRMPRRLASETNWYEDYINEK